MSVTPITEAPPKRSRRKPPEGPPPPPTWQPPVGFPGHAAAILKKNRISKKQFTRVAEQIALFLMANASADFAIAVQGGLRKGNTRVMEMFAKMAGLIKNDSGVTVNLNQNNLNVQAGQERREIDQLVRMLDERDRSAPAIAAPVAADIIDVEPEDEEE